MPQLQSALGIFALLALAWAISENRRAVSLRQAAIGLAVTFATALVLLKLPVVTHAFAAINDAVGAIAADQWDRLAGPDNPFMSHAFLTALEDSGSVGPGTGWSPAPIRIWCASAFCRACPRT